jgi:glycosyltransferase involved in cell wall biosynthesis
MLASGIDFELLIAGSKNQPIPLSKIEKLHILEIPEYSDDDIPEIVKKMDIGIMPLFDTPAERGKCAMKMLIYMAGELPVVASPVGESFYIVREGQNGFLAETAAEWEAKLSRLIGDADLRKKIGKAGKQTVTERYSQDIIFRKMISEIFPDESIKNEPYANRT